MQHLARHGWRAVDPPRRPVLFVNPRSGGGRAAHTNLVERARERGIDVVVLQTHQDLAALVGEAVAGGADALGAAGGDGSLAAVATAARAHGLPFVCVPAGTRNHLALDLGVDRHDLVGALDAFTDGVERPIDVAEVNGLRPGWGETPAAWITPVTSPSAVAVSTSACTDARDDTSTVSVVTSKPASRITSAAASAFSTHRSASAMCLPALTRRSPGRSTLLRSR
jgi:hypothetical protein